MVGLPACAKSVASEIIVCKSMLVDTHWERFWIRPGISTGGACSTFFMSAMAIARTFDWRMASWSSP